MDAVKIPQMVDDPPNVLMWTADELAPVTLGLILGIFLEQLALMAFLGLVLAHFYRRYRDGRPDGYSLHLLYWLGLVSTRSRSAPNPYIRRFLP